MVIAATIGIAAIGTFSGRLSAKPESNDRKFTFSYQFTVKDIPATANDVELYIPMPPSDEYQTVGRVNIESPYVYKQIVDPEYGNHILLVDVSDEIPHDIDMSVSFNVDRQENRALDEPKMQNPETQENLERYLKPDSLVPVNGKIAEEARSVVNSNMTDMEKIEALYEHLFETMKYDKTVAGWGRGDANFACDSRRGNCTDIHSLFIGMVRSIGIPARFIMGFPLPEGTQEGEISGYHCWAEFYIKDRGWIPVDISEAIQHPDAKSYLFGHLDPNRVAFTRGRDIKVPTADGVETLNYFIYPYVLVDGKPFTNVTTKFGFADK